MRAHVEKRSVLGWNKSYPVELAEFADQNGIRDEMGFAYWIYYIIKKKSRIVDRIK